MRALVKAASIAPQPSWTSLGRAAQQLEYRAISGKVVLAVGEA
jgi:hypothetical protein